MSLRLKPVLPVDLRPNKELKRAGTRIASTVSSGPASNSNTRAEGSSVSRLANTQPALPAPTMTKSKKSVDGAELVDVMPRRYTHAEVSHHQMVTDLTLPSDVCGLAYHPAGTSVGGRVQE